MNRILKTFLLWMLIAVLPLNAVGAALGMSCAAGHQQAAPAAISHDAGHVTRADMDQHAHAADHNPHVASASQQPDHAGHPTCSACSAFCMGAVAPPPVAIPTPSFSGSEDLIVSAAPWVSGFIPEGLRRPPRQISA